MNVAGGVETEIGHCFEAAEGSVRCGRGIATSLFLS